MPTEDRVTRRDRIRKEEIFNRLNIRIGIIDIIRNKRLQYFGHLNRMRNERYPKIAYNGYAHGTTKRGRSRKRWIDIIRGHPFMTSTKKSRLWSPPLSACVHMGRTLPLPPLWTSTHGRHETHNALLKWLVQWPTGPQAEIRLYDSNLFKLYF